MKYNKWIVEGSFPPGDFSFATEREADDFVKKKRLEGYLVHEPRIKNGFVK